MLKHRATPDSSLHKAGVDIAARRALEQIAAIAQKAIATNQPGSPDSREADATPQQVARLPRAAATPAPAASGAGLSGPEQRILDALVDLAGIGVTSPEREMVAFLAGYSHLSSKGFANGIGALNSAGHVSYPERGRIRIESSGIALAKQQAAPISNAELHDRICNLLGGASARILRPLIEQYPRPMARGELASRAGYGHTSSKGFANAIGRMRTLGFIDYPSTGLVTARDVLFPESIL
jgi:hypothetical protein